MLFMDIHHEVKRSFSCSTFQHQIDPIQHQFSDPKRIYRLLSLCCPMFNYVSNFHFRIRKSAINIPKYEKNLSDQSDY